MREILDYKILSVTLNGKADVDRLEAEVRKGFDSAWEPIGGPVFVAGNLMQAVVQYGSGE